MYNDVTTRRFPPPPTHTPPNPTIPLILPNGHTADSTHTAHITRTTHTELQRYNYGLSFEIFEQCPVDLPVIFTTAYDEYAIKAFKVNSIDYLLKPIEESDLEAALCKFERNSALRSAAPEYRQLELGYLAANKKNRFLVQVGDTFRYVETPDVAFFYSEDKLTYLHLFSGKRYIISYSLDQLEGMLDRDVFFRVSRSCISNIRSIRKSSRYFGSRLKLYFEPECPHEVLVSRSRVADFLKWVDGVV